MTIKDAQQRIIDIRKLQKDWDGYNALPIPFEVCKLAENLLQKLNHVPEIFPTARESIQFQWENNSDYAEVEIFLNKLEVLVKFNNIYYDFDLDVSQFWIVEEIVKLIINRENTE